MEPNSVAPHHLPKFGARSWRKAAQHYTALDLASPALSYKMRSSLQTFFHVGQRGSPEILRKPNFNHNRNKPLPITRSAMSSETNNTILVTGATGFLGKVVVEELLRLREKHATNQVILLLRKKDPLDAQARFEQHVAPSPCFASLPKDWKRSILVIEGDLSSPNCGLQACQYKLVCQTITHIIHTAACIKFDSTVPEAISSNIDSSCHILALAKNCNNLQRLVITSTAYVTPPQQGPIYESLVDLPSPASQIASELRNGVLGKEEAIAATGHPNIYSLSKCLAEHLICETRGSLPVTIVRPSIICAAIQNPSPGWIDSRAAFGGLVLGFGTGSLRVIDGRPETKLDIVPVDLVANCLIYETFRKDIQSL
ncbi:Uncharacterized protein HZ326_25281, partial [Fusarium oxysporum f. sp. albedinis]